MKFLMGKEFGILMFMIMLNLAVNIHQVVASVEAFCDHNMFQSHECGKYCDEDKSYWCDTSDKPNAKIGDPATECYLNENSCKPEWKCVSSCKVNKDHLNPYKIWGKKTNK